MRGLVIIIVLFVIANIAFVIFTGTLSFGLVSDNYYADEIAYQQQIDRLNRTAALAEPVVVRYDPRQGVIIRFPSQFEPAAISGTIKLFRPSDKRLDRRFPIALNLEGVQAIPDLSLPVSGLWKVKIYWQVEGVEYYSEEELVVR